ncbi:hypothetical protein M758_8G126400 [Ceratodon purpureus]|nr:hypothetical protein M758_8G126400 [Ceratodon purpureus]
MDDRSASSMEDGEFTWVDPRLIKFSQACISPTFRRKILKNQSDEKMSYSEAASAQSNRPLSLKAAVEQLKAGELQVVDFPPIRVVPHQGVLYTLDNRRLWVFKTFGASKIPVILQQEADKEFFQKLSREGDGDSVTFITLTEAQDYNKKRTLLSIVLKWSLDDVLNAYLYVNKVQSIPTRFESLPTYLESFKDPLVEEIRAQLQQSFEAIQEASYVRLKKVEERESKRDSDAQNLTTFLLWVDTGKAMVKRGKEPWKPKPTDLILLTNKVPQSDCDELKRSGVIYTLGILKGSREDDGNVLSATVYAPPESPEYQSLCELDDEFFAIQMGNLATSKRIWEALDIGTADLRENLPILNSLLYSQSGGDSGNSDSSGDPRSHTRMRLEWLHRYCEYRQLNESQATAVKTSITGLMLELKPRIRLIQGPPGTGKTATLATLLSILSSSEHRTLVCAPTNVAISEVILRFLRFFNAANKSLLFGQFCASETEVGGHSVRLGDLVLIGNEDRLDLEGSLESIFLDRRVERLIRALSPHSGWKASTSALVEFLNSATVQYETYKETHDTSFMEFFRERASSLVEEFLEHCDILSNDLPSAYLPTRWLSVLRKCSAVVMRFTDTLAGSDLKEAHVLLFFQESATKKNSDFAKAVYELQDALTAMPHNVALPHILRQPSKEGLQKECLERAKLVFSTVTSAGRHIVQRSKTFDCVIVDEASQCVEAESVIVARMSGVKQMVLVGDQMQLPATVISQIAVGCGYGRSLFERLQSLGHPVHLLNVQYRMHPEISKFPNAQFYGGNVQDGRNVTMEPYLTEHDYSGPYKFINVRDGREQRDEGRSKSWTNLVEVEIVVLLIARIHEACSKAKVKKLDVGVISPYKSQVENLERRLSRFNVMGDFTVEVKSVDGFQGREKDIIVFSTVRSNRDGNIGFLQDHRRLNVAITRAKYCMFIVGNAATLASRDAVWKALCEDAKQRKCIINPSSDPDMTKTIRRVMQELDQLDKLLDPKSVLFHDSLWKVSFGKELLKTITKIESVQSRQHLINAMLNLAKGKRSPHLKPTMLASARYRKLIQVQLVADYFLVWTVDLENNKQILKVWDAVLNSGVGAYVRRLEGGFSMYTDEHLKRCCVLKRTSQNNLVVPAQWSSDQSVAKFKTLEQRSVKPLPDRDVEADEDKKSLRENSAVDDSVLLMKFYSLSSGIAHQLLTASDGSQLSLPFDVNEQEAAIIQYPSSSFIIGRSGTGKTTVITTKLLEREQKFWIASNGTSGGDCEDDSGTSTTFLKQALITLSPKLCAAVKHNISKTRRSMQLATDGAAAERDESDVFEEMMLDDEAEAKLMGAIPDNFMEIPSDCYPLVITFRKLLTMLDGSISRSYFALNPQDPNEKTAVTLLEVGNETADNGKEDEDFSDIEDEENFSDNGDDKADESSQDGSKPARWEGTEVEFERFGTLYWPHFDAKLTKNLDPSLVYTEIMSYIKGSLEALRSPQGRLSREDYVAMADRRSSLHSEQQRDNIYSLFLKYEKRKRETFEYDVADLVTHIYFELQSGGGFLGEKMSFVYVDEVQDFTQAQIALYKFICLNLETGFVFAGDTAQTIARGVGFRFEDARRLYYEEFLGKKSECEQRNVNSESMMKVPDLFQLTMNFRTHMGVVSIADSVVKLLHHFFPNSIDKLDPEQSLLEGEVPVFLKTEENRGLVTCLFDMEATAGGGGCEFGAEQVILVRNNDIKQQIGDRGLVLNVHDCKGLEFQDVLLYNFFTDSPLRNKWRVIYAFMAEQGSATNLTFPTFDVKHHNLLCSELKQLYVMLTRARQRLWIYDECIENHKPMLDYWMASGLVQVKQLDATLAGELKSQSTAEDWNKRGVKMFNEHQYDAAKLCFDRAGESGKAQHAKAAGLQQAAEKLHGTNPKEAAKLLRQAAELYIAIEKGESAAKCYQKIGDLKKAAFVFQDVCKPPNLEAAGDCFIEAKCWEEAARAYSRSNAIKCLQTCWRGKLYEIGLRYVEEWGHESKPMHESTPMKDTQSTKKEKSEFDGARTEFLKKGASHYHLERKVEEMMKFVLLFPSLTMRRSFLMRRDHTDQLQRIEEAAGNYEKAAELAEVNGKLQDAAKLLVRAGSIPLAVEKLLHYASMELFWKDGNKGWPMQLTPEVNQALEYTKSIFFHTNSAVRWALLHELQILQDVGRTDIRLRRQHYEQARKLKETRLELLGSYLLLQNLEQTISAVVSNFTRYEVDISAVGGLMREEVPILTEVWNHWSKCIDSVVHALDRLRKGRGREEDEPILRSIYCYLGVANHSKPHTVAVENPKAYWLANSSIKVSNNIPVQEFANLAMQFFDGELIQIGDRLESRLSILGDVLTGIVNMKDRVIDLFHVLLLRFKILLRMANTCDEVRRVQSCRILEIARQLHTLIFIDMPLHSMKEVVVIRESPEAAQAFEILAKELTDNLLTPEEIHMISLCRSLTYDRLGTLVTLQPFLGINWALEEAFSQGKKSFKELCKFRLWNGSLSQRSAFVKSTSKPDCSFWSSKIYDFMSSLRDIYFKEDFQADGYISPVVFLALFERGVVATCAKSTHLRSMLISESMALCNMGGKHYEPYYSMLLSLTCDRNCENRQQGVLEFAVELILDMLFNFGTVEQWFESSAFSKDTYRQLVIFRLIQLVITICINTKAGKIHNQVNLGLTKLFGVQCPVLAELPRQFREELLDHFDYRANGARLTPLVSAFSRAMNSIGDPLVFLKRFGPRHNNMSWHGSASRSLRVVMVELRDQPSVFTLDNLEQSASDITNRFMSFNIDNNEESLAIEDDEGAQENETSEELLELLKDNPDDTKDIPVAPSDIVILEDGSKLSRAFVKQLKMLLAAARERISIPLTPLERYQREARLIFLRKQITDKVYIDLFNSEACSLLVWLAFSHLAYMPIDIRSIILGKITN